MFNLDKNQMLILLVVLAVMLFMWQCQSEGFTAWGDHHYHPYPVTPSITRQTVHPGCDYRPNRLMPKFSHGVEGYTDSVPADFAHDGGYAMMPEAVPPVAEDEELVTDENGNIIGVLKKRFQSTNISMAIMVAVLLYVVWMLWKNME